jgi:cystathionine beta-lyase/cystathionine gamma-synthase
MDIKTICVHGGRTADPTGAVAVPIYQSATFAHPGVGRSTGYDYSRTQNPTRARVERQMAELDGAAEALAFSTGMAAVSCLMETFEPGDRIIAADDLYGGTIRLFENVSKKNGLDIVYGEDASGIAALIDGKTAAVFIETPTNPMMNVIDIAACTDAAKKAGAALIVDNTFLTPAFCRPLELGADICLYSGTKYLGGHNDTLAGFLTVKRAETAERLRFIAKTTGACLSPMDSFLISRGIKTLHLRMERSSQNAMEAARWLNGHESVTRVYYPGLESHPGHEIMKRQSSGFGAMLSFAVKDEETARRALESVRLIQYAESLGGVDSLMTYPMLQTHADVPEEIRLKKGIDGRLLRLSVGIEAAEDIISDLRAAFE